MLLASRTCTIDRRKGLEKFSSISDTPAATVLPSAGLLAVIFACASAVVCAVTRSNTMSNTMSVAV